MTSTSIFLTVLSSLTIFYVILGIIASRFVKDTADYFVAGRSVGLFPVTCTLIATQLGGGMLLGTSQEAYTYGIFGILYTLGMTLGFLIMSMGIAGKLQALNITTTASLFKIKYKSDVLKYIASALSIITLSGILISQMVASRSVFHAMNVHSEPLFIGFWLFIILYTMMGGLKAVVIIDSVQVIFIIGVFAAIFCWSLWHQSPTFISFESLRELHNVQFDLFGITWQQIVSIILAPALFSLIEQDLAQRFFAARTRRIAMLAAFLSGIFMILFSFVPIYFGMQARIMNLLVHHTMSPLIVIIRFLTNDIVVSLALCGIMAAITSTADSLLCAISSNLSQDFPFNRFKSYGLAYARIITLTIGLATLALSYYVPQNIIGILINSYQISIGCLLIPYLIAYTTDQVSTSGAFGSVIGGFIGMGITYALAPDWPLLILSLAGSIIGYILGSFISHHPTVAKNIHHE